MKRPLIAVMGLFVGMVVAGCQPLVDARGHNNEAMDMSQIVVGQSRAEDVMALLGAPSTRSSFGDEVWYYISARKETYGLFAPEVTAQDVVAVHFDVNQVVTEISDHDETKAMNVQFVEKTTPTEGRTLGIMEQLLGNVGRFSGGGGGQGGMMGPRGPSPNSGRY